MQPLSGTVRTNRRQRTRLTFIHWVLIDPGWRLSAWAWDDCVQLPPGEPETFCAYLAAFRRCGYGADADRLRAAWDRYALTACKPPAGDVDCGLAA